MAFSWENQIALIDVNILNNVGNALRYRLKENDTYLPAQFEEAINNIAGIDYVAFQYPTYSPNYPGELWCGTNVTDLTRAYCHKTLYSDPVTGPNVVNMNYAYDSAVNVTGTINFMQDFNGDYTTVNGYMMFANRNNSLPLYVNLVEKSAWYNWWRYNCMAYGDTPLTWVVFDEDYLVNSETNTYIQAKLLNCVYLNHFTINTLTETFTVNYGI